jgi:transcription initiation factor TFIID subunit 5
VTSTNPTAISPHAWEESTGLLSSVIPSISGTGHTSAQAYNKSRGELKLGLAPLSEELKSEVEQVLNQQAFLDRDANGGVTDLQTIRNEMAQGLISPAEGDLLPHPPLFKTEDVKREVERVRDIRKRIRLDPSALYNLDANSPESSAARARALPSICAYTLHDCPGGYISYIFKLTKSLIGFA